MNLQERYNEVVQFNELAGNLNNVNVESVQAQMKVFIEEAKETADAFDNKDAVELLDGVCDSFVTLAGLMQQLVAAGFNVDKALKRVNNNNLTKFPRTASVEDYPEEYNIEFVQGRNVYVIKDTNGKVKKPVGFVPVEIADLAPKGFFGEAK